ncbi:hypothetical protein EVAR_42779_1 [Eumeta japonica]|uniref:Uncharacterized protein n=1 Tax=Eumeta variegata TaxID=151549 RepID=A0A4C1WJH0_EUMVA|nr:hypothetical protein EVAR_42779_1 [Eumeta japonica]
MESCRVMEVDIKSKKSIEIRCARSSQWILLASTVSSTSEGLSKRNQTPCAQRALHLSRRKFSRDCLRAPRRDAIPGSGYRWGQWRQRGPPPYLRFGSVHAQCGTEDERTLCDKPLKALSK